MNIDCEFHNPGRLMDEDLELVLVETCPADPGTGRVTEYRFNMRLVNKETVIGSISLRVQCTERLEQYGGNLSYEVNEAYRGNRYAARGCRLLFPLAISHGLDSLLITCHATNRASRRTCELLGARYVDTIEIEREPGEFGPTSRYELRLNTEEEANLQFAADHGRSAAQGNISHDKMKRKNKKINLRPFEKTGDAQILGEWLKRNHVSKWWGDPEKRFCECVNRPLSGGHAMINVGRDPVGYIRWRRMTREELNLIGENEISDKTVDVDILIGEKSYLNGGIGSGALSELKERLRLDPTVSSMGIGTSRKNTRAIRAFKKVGFRPVKTMVSSEFGDVLVMVCEL